MESNGPGIDGRVLAAGGALALIAAAVVVPIGIGGNQPVGYAGPSIAAGGVLIATFALVGFE